MQIEIYADIFFAINFVMDLLIFWAAAKFLRTKINFGRIFLGSLTISILYCILILTSNLNYSMVFIILIAGIIITFRPKNFRSIIKLIFLVHLIAFTIGGMATALFFYIDFSPFLSNIFFFELENFSLKILILSTCISFVFIKLFIEYVRRSAFSKQIFYQVKIFLGKSNSIFNALVDTGNSLYDEISGKPIIIVQYRAVENIFTDEIKLAIRKKDFEKLCLSNIKFIFVPYKSVGNENGILICFQPDYVQILCEKEKMFSDILIGVCNFNLSDSYHALINPDLLN